MGARSGGVVPHVRRILRSLALAAVLAGGADFVAAPPMGTGGAAGALRMSSMLWIGVMPQIGSRENGHPYASAPTSLPST